MAVVLMVASKDHALVLEYSTSESVDVSALILQLFLATDLLLSTKIQMSAIALAMLISHAIWPTNILTMMQMSALAFAL